MSIESILRSEGISIIRRLSTLEVNIIASKIAEKISSVFSEYFLDYDDLFSLLSRINMFLVKMPSDSSVAKYLYKNNSIYLSENIDLTSTESSIFVIHECIHFLQTQSNKSKNLVRLGLYNLNNHGIALNEAAVQLMAATAHENSLDTVKYYDIYINTISPDSYPLQCAILEEMVYFTGVYPLYHSTLNSNDVFKNTFISYSNKKTYSQISENLDRLLKLEDDLYYFYIELSNATSNKDIKLLNRIIANRKYTIKKIFFNTQNLIIQNCFTKEFNNIYNLEDIKKFQTKLYNFKNVLCYSDDYTFYNEFYCNSMSALDKIREYIELNGNMVEYRNTNQSLTIVDNSNKFIKFLKLFIKKTRKLFNITNSNVKEISETKKY